MPDMNRITLVIENLPDGHAQVHVDIPTPRPGMRLETAAHALAIDAVGWLGKQPAVAGFLYDVGATAAQTKPQFPAMTATLERILGTMCFECIPLANMLRAGGQQIAQKAEAEQAAVLHWKLSLYFTHGDDWAEAAIAEVERMRTEALGQEEGAAA